MAVKYIFSIDIGTSSLKAALIDEEGFSHWFYRDNTITHYNQLSSWDPLIWENSLWTITQTLNQQVSKGLFKVDAIVLSGNGPSLIPLDKYGRSTSSALLWINQKEISLSDTKSFYLPKIAWFREHEPEAFLRTCQFFSCPEYLVYKLCGEARTISPSSNFEPFIWSSDEIDRYQINPNLLPAFGFPGDLIGCVHEQASDFYGLTKGIPVFCGGSDFLMSLVGTGTLKPGMTCDRAGSSEGVNYCSAFKVQDKRLRTLPHVIEGRWNVASILSFTGLMLEWLRRITGLESVTYGTMFEKIKNMPLSDSYPWFFPNHCHTTSWKFGKENFINLRPEHTPLHLARSVVESIGFSVHEAIEILKESSCSIDELRICGGQAKNEAWNQIKASIIGKPVWIPQVKDAELMGNAIVGFVGLGHYANIEEAIKMVKLDKIIEPARLAHSTYSERYAIYKEEQKNNVSYNGSQ